MKYRILSKTEKEIYGADAMAIVDYTDVAGLGAATSGVLSVAPATTAGAMPAAGTTGTDTLPAGTKAKLIAVIVDTAFVSATATSLTAAFGDGGSANRFQTAVQLQSGQTPITFAVGTISTNEYVYTVADTIDVTFTSVAANLSTFTAGAMRVFFRLDDLNALPNV